MFNENETTSSYHVTPMQEGMVYHSLSEPDSLVYRCQFIYSLHSDELLDLQKLEKAWKATILAYPVVTTKFYWESGFLLQELRSDYVLPLKLASSREDFYNKAEQALNAIDLLKNNIFEVLIDVSSNLMAVTFHHAILDGWSLALIIDRLAKEYLQLSSRQQNIPQFGEYVFWLVEKHTKLLTPTEEFWRQELSNVHPTLISPLLTPQPHENLVPISRGRLTERQNFSFDVVHGISERAKDLCVSQFAICQAAWLIVLSKFLDDLDIVTGVTVSGRHFSDFHNIESLAGLLINTIPYRMTMDQNERLDNLIQRIHSKFQDILEYSHVPLSMLNSLCNLSNGEQLFDSIVVFENYPIPLQEAKFSIVPQQVKEQTNFPLSLCIDMKGVSIHFNGEKIGQHSARLMLRSFLMVLGQMVSPKAGSLICKEIEIVSEAEKNELLAYGENINGINLNSGQGETLYSLFEKQALLSPNNIAVLDNGKGYTYEQIMENAKNIAASIVFEYSKSKDSPFIVICIKRSHWLISSMMGVHIAGRAFVLLDESTPLKKIKSILSDIKCSMIITLSDDIPSTISSLNIPLIFVDKVKKSDAPNFSRDSNEISHIIYTSGSTGQPKGVIITHKNMVSRLASKTTNWEPSWLNIGPGDIAANLCSPSFDVYFSEVFHALINGACVGIIPEKIVLSPKEMAVFFGEIGITHAFMPTALFHILAATCPKIFSSLKHIHVGGEVLQLPLLWKVIEACGNKLPPLGFVNGYGPTEATIGSHRYIIRNLKQLSALSSVPIGHPCPMTLQYIIDKCGNLAPKGMVGELLLGGDCVSPGYFKQPDLTAQKFTNNLKINTKHVLYNTGDLVRLTETGDLEFFGRRDLQAKIRGYRIEIEEVELALLTCSNIASAAVVSSNNALIAFLVSSSPQLEYSKLLKELRELLPPYMIPNKFMVLESIPITTGGKVDRNALIASESSAKLLISLADENDNDVEMDSVGLTLSKIWTEILGISHIRGNSNFFELGGDSLLAMRTVRYADEQGIDISVHDIFKNPIFKDLLKVVSLKKENSLPVIKNEYSKPTPNPKHEQSIDAGIVSLGVAVPDKKFRSDKLSELLDFLIARGFHTEYIQHINDTGKCPGTLIGNEWYTNKPWFNTWLKTVAKSKDDPFEGINTRARFPLDPISLRESRHPFSMLSSDASVLAGAAAIVYAGINPLDIDGFIDCAVPQNDVSNTNYLMVHHKLGLKNAVPLSLFTACTSFISAIDLAVAYVRSGLRKRVLVCVTQIGSHISDPTSPAGFKIADGAVAAIVSSVQQGEGYLGSHGAGRGEFSGSTDLSWKPPHMYIEPPRAMNFYSYVNLKPLYDIAFESIVEDMVSVCNIALQKSYITDNSQVFLAPHQSNNELPLLWARELGIKKLYFSWKQYASMGPACPAVNLYEAIESGKLSSGEVALLAASGIGMNYYALVERITKALEISIKGS